MENSDVLITLHLDGDSTAFPKLVEIHLKYVYNFARRFVGNSEDAEDITQETFIKVWKKLHTFRAGANFRTWILTIAHHTAIDYLRKKKALPLSLFETDDGDNLILERTAGPELKPDEIFAHAEQKAILDELLLKLPLAQRQVITLYHSGHMTFDDIAQILGKPLNTVKSQYRRGLLLLKELCTNTDDLSVE